MDISELKAFCALGKIKWHKHALERMQERDITRDDAIHCIMSGKIIEEYPDDFPKPSCLVFGHTVNGSVLHVVVCFDGEKIGIITAYFPDAKKFESDFKTRRRQ